MKRLGRAEQRAAYLFLTPALVGAVIFAYGPIVMALLLSFSHYSMLDTPRWIGLANVFDQVYVMTQGGPSNSTLTVVYEIYCNAFAYLRMGYASAEAMLLFVIILVFSLLNLRRLRVDWA